MVRQRREGGHNATAASNCALWPEYWCLVGHMIISRAAESDWRHPTCRVHVFAAVAGACTQWSRCERRASCIDCQWLHHAMNTLPRPACQPSSGWLQQTCSNGPYLHLWLGQIPVSARAVYVTHASRQAHVEKAALDAAQSIHHVRKAGVLALKKPNYLIKALLLVHLPRAQAVRDKI